MELLAFLLIWPLILLVFGFAFISAADVLGALMMLPLIVIALIFIFGTGAYLREKGVVGGDVSEWEDLDRVRRGTVAFSIAILLPLFTKYLLAASGNDLPTMILGLVFGFGILIWGMFMKGNKVLMYANGVGGGLVIIYLYFQIWHLGQLAQIVASAFGLAVAVIVSIIKFREKLT